ncbi:paraquat-inducible protein A [Pseudothioclava nitratireducens]|uniref:paraquat-inducible protein A n=1 Tax=Pseudothioclava nitratireducens TaxID=1928646 RepID=UPI0023DC9F15|nr:paraquat-inducible protein A [Defluviimonas nitratireducens]MDF1619872.1 paraquat-inducible protein A [Defluviimonas nitratireducens]
MGSDRTEMNVLTARAAGLIGCTRCGRVWPGEASHCGRCGAPLAPVTTISLQRVWAWWFAGLIAYVPANMLPMLRTATLGHEQANTILGGVIELVAHHNYGVAAIVFIASIMIPVAKFIAIGYLALIVAHEKFAGSHRHLHLYEVVEFIGRWSMIDVFVVAILSALVQLGFVASIHPGPAAASFALSVAFTMLSAQNFDPRLIWLPPLGTDKA